MAETPKTPNDLKFRKLRKKSGENDDYQEYMRAVLRQANEYPDKPIGIRTH